jgi:crotonobetainyl-CoA:carnitine CoA-transferase CaiB-like acyl-CoA transferase
MAILPYNDKHWRNFFEIVGRPEVLKDPRYSTLNARSLHIGDMYAMVEALAPTRTTAEWVVLLDKGQIPNAPVLRPADLFEDRGFQDVFQGAGGQDPCRAGLNPRRWSAAPPHPGPCATGRTHRPAGPAHR